MRISAGPRARARTNLRFPSWHSWRAPPERNTARVRPVGCMRGLGGTLGKSAPKSQALLHFHQIGGQVLDLSRLHHENIAVP